MGRAKAEAVSTHEGYGTQFVCASVCPLSTRHLEGLYYNFNITAGFTLLLQDNQLTDNF